jgi:hypothetical protein
MPYASGCHHCGERRAPGRAKCPSCLEAAREKAAKVRRRRRQLKLCLTCGEKVVHGRRYCAADLAYYRERWRAIGQALRVRKRTA